MISFGKVDETVVAPLHLYVMLHLSFWLKNAEWKPQFSIMVIYKIQLRCDGTYRGGFRIIWDPVVGWEVSPSLAREPVALFHLLGKPRGWLLYLGSTEMCSQTRVGDYSWVWPRRTSRAFWSDRHISVVTHKSLDISNIYDSFESFWIMVQFHVSVVFMLVIVLGI